MADPEQEQTTQLGLLDLTIDLSVPQVYSGTDFTVYLHIKNPFSLPVWIDAVELSLPTQLYWRAPVRPKLADEQHRGGTEGAMDDDRVLEYSAKRADLLKRLEETPSEDSTTRSQLQDELRTLEEQHERYLTLSGNLLHVTTNNSALVNIYGLGGTGHITANDAATVNIHGARADDTERVPLIGSLPTGAALVQRRVSSLGV